MTVKNIKITHGNISKQSGLIVYRDAVTKLLWDVFLRYFGFGRGGPLDVYVKIPDLGDKASQIQVDVIIKKKRCSYSALDEHRRNL